MKTHNRNISGCNPRMLWNIDVRWCCFKEDIWQIFEEVKQLKVKEKKL